MSKIWKGIIYIIIVAILGGSVYAILNHAGVFSKKDFYLSCKEQEITSIASDFEMSRDKPLEVDINFYDEAVGYSIKVIPNKIEGKDFDFKLDEDVYSYQSERDLTGGFDIERKDNTFTIKPKGGITEILQAIYPNNIVEDCRVNAYENMYTLAVISEDEGTSILINFSIPETLAGVVLDMEEIVF